MPCTELGSGFFPVPLCPPNLMAINHEIVKALLGKAVVPDDSPYTTGLVGLLGTKPSQEVMENCDTCTQYPEL